jgi:hypothetical protein
MRTFPENLELIEFFESEPVVSEPDIPWAYCCLSFSARLGEERVECVIDNPQLEVRWFRHDLEVAFLTLHPVIELAVQEYPGGKALVAQGVGPNQDLAFRLQLRPRVHLALLSSQ